jgi:hypothetical protein
MKVCKKTQTIRTIPAANARKRELPRPDAAYRVALTTALCTSLAMYAAAVFKLSAVRVSFQGRIAAADRV